MRSGPDTGHPIIGVVPSGVSPTYNCYAVGEYVHGVRVWFNATYDGETGFISSYYDSSSYGSPESIPGKYGIPACDVGSTTVPDPMTSERTTAEVIPNSTDPAPDLGLYCEAVKKPWDPSGTGTFEYQRNGAGWESTYERPICKYWQISGGDSDGNRGLFPSYMLPYDVLGTWEEACDSSYGPQSSAVVTPYPLFSVTCRDASIDYYTSAQVPG